MENPINNLVSVAPMLDWTDKHCRFLHRLISPDVLLYTEMVTAPAILRGNTDKYIGYNQQEHPVVLQLGGSDAEELRHCCEVAENYGYDAVNLNVGCPSDRVQKGRFGACLMKEPELVADCVRQMQQSANIPITVKCRIGVDDKDKFEDLTEFIDKVSASGIKTIIIHARKAWLKGLSPKQNRSVPPLKYDYVYKVKKLFPELEIVINGGINSVEEAKQHLMHVDGVMLGRAIWNSPWLLFNLQNELFETKVSCTRDQVLEKYIEYCQLQIDAGVKLHWLIPPILGLFHGLPGNNNWKSHLVINAPKRISDISVFAEARGFINI